MNAVELIGKLIKGGFDSRQAGDIVSWLADLYKYDGIQALGTLEQMYAEGLAKDGNLTHRIRDYIEATQGYFDGNECDRELLLSPKQKEQRRVILNRLVIEKILERHPSRNGVFRRIEVNSPIIEWEKADVSDVFKIKWPFQLEDYVVIYPKNEIVLAGESNAGKTGFLLDTIRLNQGEHKIHYYSSEMGAEELKLRLSKFEVEKWTFDARERSSNYADVIYPDDINIIDYIEIPSGEYYLIANELRAIFDKLRRGIAIVALQKKKDTDLGRGAEFSLEKPRLYLSMGHGTLKIVKAKNWADREHNPNGLEFTFKLVDGAKFVNIFPKEDV